jgi:acyl-CoA reductase-like NAD-dependent aldehyde dehydrogenase
VVALVGEGQVRQAKRLVLEAKELGGRLLDDTPTPPDAEPHAFRPAVVIDAKPEMSICKEDSFAPLLAVMPFDTVEQALQLDAVCPYGLGSAVFTADPKAAERLAERLAVGMVAVNDLIIATAHPATPLGGRRESGWGATQGAEGLLEMTEPQVVSHGFGKFRPHYDLAAGGKGGMGELLRGVLEWQHAETWSERFRGLGRVVRYVRNAGKAPPP